MKTLLISFIFLFPAFCAKAQHDLPDTLFPVALQPVDTIAPGDAILKRVFCSLKDLPVCFFDTSDSYFDNKIWMAVKKDSFYIIYDPGLGTTESDKVEFMRVDFNGSGRLELIIKWRAGWSHMCANYAMSSVSGGIKLIDPDKMEMIFDLQTHYSEHWEYSNKEENEGRQSNIEPEGDDHFDHPVFISKDKIRVSCSLKRNWSAMYMRKGDRLVKK
ncbi:MAG TPA: hypothetical protein VI112_13445 [Bacteroidia bacterium]|jgi:hypothetical protein